MSVIRTVKNGLIGTNRSRRPGILPNLTLSLTRRKMLFGNPPLVLLILLWILKGEHYSYLSSWFPIYYSGTGGSQFSWSISSTVLQLFSGSSAVKIMLRISGRRTELCWAHLPPQRCFLTIKFWHFGVRYLSLLFGNYFLQRHNAKWKGFRSSNGL